MRLAREKRALAAALALIATLALGAGCGRGSAGGDGNADESRTSAVVPVEIATVTLRPFTDLISAPGQWRSGGDLVVAASTAGVLENLVVRVGDRVAAGQRLGTLVARDSWAALQGAEMLRHEARDPAARADGERALALARRELVRLPLRAAQPGVVVRRSIEPGAQVAEGAEILALVPDRAVVFEAHVPPAAAARVRPGQPASILVEATPPRAATVQRVLPTAGSADQSVLVWLAPRAVDRSLALDRYGTAEIQVGGARRSPAVPDTAIVEDDLTGQRRVAVVGAANRISWTTVAVGAAAQGWRELVGSRLAPGTRVVVEGQRGLPDSTRVAPRP